MNLGRFCLLASWFTRLTLFVSYPSIKVSFDDKPQKCSDQIIIVYCCWYIFGVFRTTDLWWRDRGSNSQSVHYQLVTTWMGHSLQFQYVTN